MKKIILFILGATLPTIGLASFDDGLEAARQGNWEAAFKEWRPLAGSGDKDAQKYLCMSYGFFHKLKSNEEGLKWCSKAAEQGDNASQEMLGDIYSNGQGVKKDVKQAVKWYTKAADGGDVEAQNKLNGLYNSGQIDKPYKSKGKWTKFASNSFQTAYYDPSSIREWDHKKVEVKVLNDMVSAMPGIGGKYLSLKTRVSLDCDNRLARVDTMAMHTEHMGNGKTIWEDSSPGQWAPIDDTDLTYPPIKSVCKL